MPRKETLKALARLWERPRLASSIAVGASAVEAVRRVLSAAEHEGGGSMITFELPTWGAILVAGGVGIGIAAVLWVLIGLFRGPRDIGEPPAGEDDTESTIVVSAHLRNVAYQFPVSADAVAGLIFGSIAEGRGQANGRSAAGDDEAPVSTGQQSRGPRGGG